jgi:hypothetical protein
MVLMIDLEINAKLVRFISSILRLAIMLIGMVKFATAPLKALNG